jgi:hypothetical protein
MTSGRLVGADLLRGDDEVEVDREVAAGLFEEVVVDVGEDAQSVAGGLEAFERLVRIGERLPVLERVGEEVLLQGEPELARDAAGGFVQHVPIEVVCRLDPRLFVRVGAEERFAVETRGLLPEGVGDAGLPVDERSIAVEGDDVVAAVHS